jgi:enoyl-CoA hydratase/carnithine racemase
MPPFETLLFEKRGPIARISFNRPQALNAYNMQMRDDLSQALSAVADDADVRALLITGEGRGFCAGADLMEFGTAPSQVIARQVRWQRDVWGQMVNLDKPSVAAVHGFCIGSGVEIALLCDLRIAADDTVFAMPEVHLGMIPAAGGTQTLPRPVGPAAAMDLLLTGRRFDANEALAMRLLTRVTPAQRLVDEGWRLAEALAGLEPQPVAAMKEALRIGDDLELVQGLEFEERLAAGLLTGLLDQSVRHEHV